MITPIITGLFGLLFGMFIGFILTTGEKEKPTKSIDGTINNIIEQWDDSAHKTHGYNGYIKRRNK